MQHWPLLKKMPFAAPCDRRLEVGVGEDHVRRLAAELERDLLEVAGSRLDDQLADLGRAGERDLVDAVVRGQSRRRRPPNPVTMLTTPVGQPGLLHQLAEAQRRQRRLLGGLEHDGAAARQRRRELPCRHQQREVPRDDLADHADRLAQRVGEVLARRRQRGDRNGRALDLRRPARHVAEQVGGERHVSRARDAERLAVVERLEHRELVRVLLDQLRDPPDQAAAVGGVHTPPLRVIGERLASGLDRPLDVLFPTVRHLRKLLLGGGIERRERLARRRLHPVAVNQQLVGCAYEGLRRLLTCNSDRH